MKRWCILLLVTGCSGGPSVDGPSTFLPDTYTLTNEEDRPYVGAVTLFPEGSVAFPITSEARQVMPWFSGNANVRDGDVYFNVDDSKHSIIEFNLPRAPLWVPVPDQCNRAFMRNDSAETITVGVIFSTQ